MKFDINDTRTAHRHISDPFLRRILEENGAGELSRATAAPQRPPVGDLCGGGQGGNGLPDRPLAMVYAPLQCWSNVYDSEEGLSRGTLFAGLDLPLEV